MRLIDADALIEELDKMEYSREKHDFKRLVENQPTAYDIEKVVAELEDAIKYVTLDGKDTGLAALYPIQTIKIVRKGGVE